MGRKTRPAAFGRSFSRPGGIGEAAGAGLAAIRNPTENKRILPDKHRFLICFPELFWERTGWIYLQVSLAHRKNELTKMSRLHSHNCFTILGSNISSRGTCMGKVCNFLYVT